MSEPHDKRRALDFLDDLTQGDDELERLAKMDPDAIAKEAEAAGFDSARTLEITRRAIADADAAEAAAGKTGKAPAGERATEAAAPGADAAPPTTDAAAPAAGLPPPAGPAPGGKVVSLAERRKPPTRLAIFLVAAALAGVWAALGTGGGGVSHPAPDDTQPAPVKTPAEQARALRDQALADCGRRAWATCQLRLDDAVRLDPAGESAPDVQKARQLLADAKRSGLYDGGTP